MTKLDIDLDTIDKRCRCECSVPDMLSNDDYDESFNLQKIKIDL